MMELGLIPILNHMFHRLSCGANSSDMSIIKNYPLQHNAHGGSDDGVHGPGCECNPESALG
eukprot:4710542-Ditylum_brightwellii.AAC.1